MQLKILQLNMWAGTHWPTIKKFLHEHDFDILCFQEVMKNAPHGNVTATMDCYKALQEVLGKTHKSRFVIDTTFSRDPENSFEGNAIFYKNNFILLHEYHLRLFERSTPFPLDKKTFEDFGRGVLHVSLATQGRQVDVLSGHLPWAPSKYEQPYQRVINLRLINYMKSVPRPWILTGDFNIIPTEQSMLDLEKQGRDLIKEYNVPNTIDPVNHSAWDKLQPGFPIDYIFVSRDIEVKNFEVLDNVHMSDHFGLTATVEI